MAAYFEFQQEDPSGDINVFVFKLIDPARIAEARANIADKSGLHVQGTIIAEAKPYNPQWSFHLEPSSIRFFEMAIEVCDANVTYVAEHIDQVGTDFLPNHHWCPWSSVLTCEVTHRVDPATERLSA
jgi:hypothetical protein